MEFLIQDTYTSIRPQFKFAVSLEEATKAFQAAVAQDQKNSGVDKTIDAEEIVSDESSDDEHGDGDDAEHDGDLDDESASEEEDEDFEVSYCRSVRERLNNLTVLLGDGC